MSLENVKEFMKSCNLEDRLMVFELSTATVPLAAKAIGCSESQITKSLAFNVNDKYIVIAVSGDAKIDNKKFKDYFLVKAKMVKFEEVEEAIGHKAGGVCPFCLNEGVTLYLDESLKKHTHVYPAAGSANSCVRLSLDELQSITNNPTWIDVCKVEENA